MSHIVVRARLSARHSATADFLVDTSATHSIVPPALARKVGAPTLPQRFEVSLAEGRRRRLKACSMGVSVGGRTGPTIALLLPGSDPLLGVETLEALGLKVNPERRRLEPSRAQTALLVGVRRPRGRKPLRSTTRLENGRWVWRAQTRTDPVRAEPFPRGAARHNRPQLVRRAPARPAAEAGAAPACAR